MGSAPCTYQNDGTFYKQTRDATAIILLKEIYPYRGQETEKLRIAQNFVSRELEKAAGKIVLVQREMEFSHS